MAGGFETFIATTTGTPGGFGPALGLSPADDSALIARVRSGVAADQLAIARMPSLSPAVADALAEIAAPTIVAAMLENDQARIGDGTIAALVDRSRDVIAFRVPLLRRKELTQGHAARLYLWVSPPLREFIARSFQLDTETLERQRQGGVSREAPAQTGDGPAGLVEHLRQGENLTFEASFARLIGLRITAVRRILEDRAGDRLAVACRATGFSNQQFQDAYRLIQSTMARVSPRAASIGAPRLASLYDRIDPAEARQTLKRWRREISDPSDAVPFAADSTPLSSALNS